MQIKYPQSKLRRISGQKDVKERPWISTNLTIKQRFKDFSQKESRRIVWLMTHVVLTHKTLIMSGPQFERLNENVTSLKFNTKSVLMYHSTVRVKKIYKGTT